MTTATMRLIEAVERLNMSGEIGDGMVATLHELAGLARLEQNRAEAALRAIRDNDPAEPIADNGMTVLDAVRADAVALCGPAPH